MLDFDLATLYDVETRVLNQAVKRNIDRFPEDFMFQLEPFEFQMIRSQIEAISKNSSSQIVMMGNLPQNRISSCACRDLFHSFIPSFLH